ncbi:MAG: hypothetical protein QXX95_00945 [Nitrososphaerales archaeon]
MCDDGIKIELRGKHVVLFVVAFLIVAWVIYIPLVKPSLLITQKPIRILEPKPSVTLHDIHYLHSSISSCNVKNSMDIKLAKDLTSNNINGIFCISNEIEENEPMVVADDNQASFWSVDLLGTGVLGIGSATDDNIFVNNGLNSYKVNITTYGNHSLWRLIHDYGFLSEADWSTYDILVLYWYGGGSGSTVELRLESEPGGGFISWYFVDDHQGWKRHVFYLDSPHYAFRAGSKDILHKVRFLSLGYLPFAGVWYVDKVILDRMLGVEVEIDISGLLKTTGIVALYSYNPSTGNFEGIATNYVINQKQYTSISAPLHILDGGRSTLHFGLSADKIMLSLKLPGNGQAIIKFIIEETAYSLDIIYRPYYFVVLLLFLLLIVNGVCFYNDLLQAKKRCSVRIKEARKL